MTDQERLEEIKELLCEIKEKIEEGKREDVETINEKIIDLYLNNQIDWLTSTVEEQKQEIERLHEFAQMLLGEEWLNERGEYDTKMNRLLKQNKRYREIFEQLYSFEGNVQEHSALADMLCGEVLEVEG